MKVQEAQNSRKNRAKIEILRNLARYEGAESSKQLKNRAKIEILRNLARYKDAESQNSRRSVLNKDSF